MNTCDLKHLKPSEKSDIELRINIASLLGMKDFHLIDGISLVYGYVDDDTWINLVPKFYSDLNACHEMERKVRADGLLTAKYRKHLKNIVDAYNITHGCCVYPEFANARWRCEAFLLTMEKVETP